MRLTFKSVQQQAFKSGYQVEKATQGYTVNGQKFRLLVEVADYLNRCLEVSVAPELTINEVQQLAIGMDFLVQPMDEGYGIFYHGQLLGLAKLLSVVVEALPQYKEAIAKYHEAEPREQALAQAELEVHIEEQAQSISSQTAWDLTIPKWNLPGAICPDCNGHGCGNCNYRGTRAEDLCTPLDDYRLMYMGRTDSQIAYIAYNGNEPLGILFKVRNVEEIWENDPKTYYWQCGHDVKYWSVQDAIVALEKLTSPKEKRAILHEPIKEMELVAA